MDLSEFDYELPKEFIAQHPLEKRDESKLMVLDRKKKTIEHHQFFELPELLDENHTLVFNESRVIPARLKFKIGEGNAEILLIKPLTERHWECMVKPGVKFKPKQDIQIDTELNCHVKEITENGLRIIRFDHEDLNTYLKKKGHTPLPPYIKEEVSDAERYQTVYSGTEGSVAAPTAGFHFTKELLKKLKEKGVGIEFVTLHVGLGTFQPVKTEKIEDHKMHSEWFELKKETAERLNKAKNEGKKIIAVGTTSVRVLESCSTGDGKLEAKSGETDIFITPGYQWKFVNQLITNFHVPKSTLLMLVSSFATPGDISLQGRDFIMEAYKKAKENNYRFFSFGDSMMII